MLLSMTLVSKHNVLMRRTPYYYLCPAYILFSLVQETGVGKTVNSFRKHDLAGDLAKSLVAKWKKLVPAPSAERYIITEGFEDIF